MEKVLQKIINKHLSIWTSKTHIEKINIGFTNTVFNLNNHYISKICTNISNENAFKNEIDFYKRNKNNENIPKLIKYDVSKKEIPYIYEILEKLDGVSLYPYLPKVIKVIFLYLKK